MKKVNKKMMVMIALGISIISPSQIVHHFIELQDFYIGAFTGVGFGVLAMALVYKKIIVWLNYRDEDWLFFVKTWTR